MKEIVKVKNLCDSVDLSIFEGAGRATDSLSLKSMATLSYGQSAVETPTQNYQNIHERTNEKNNIYNFISFKGDHNRFFTCMDKRGKWAIYSFGSSNNYVDERDYQLLYEASSSTWTGNIAQNKTIFKMQQGSRQIVNRLKKFATLEAGWDSYGAKPIEWFTIARAIDFFYKVLSVLENERKKVVPVPFIAPRSDGGIQFEWSTCYKELIHSIPEGKKEPLEYLKIDMPSGEEKEEEGEVSSINDLVSIVTDWLL